VKPTISICIPTYNGARYLRECLDSVLAQTFSNFEVLIVDDKSSDETVTIAQEYAKGDQRFKIIQNEKNLGLVTNWNHCIELAQGEWIKVLFQDDLIAPACLEKLLAACQPDDAIVFCRRDFIFDETISQSLRRNYRELLDLEKLLPNSRKISPADYCKIVFQNVGTNFIGEPTVVMMRKSTFQKFGVFNPHLIQLADLEMFTRIASNVGIIYVPETLATFRVHSSAASADNLSKRVCRMKLDKAVILHEFLFNSKYENLRQLSKANWASINLAASLRKETYFAWVSFKRTIGNSTDPDLIIKGWEAVFDCYPALPKDTQFSSMEKAYYLFIRKIFYIRWYILSFLKSQFQGKESAS
jgi:glycosyltransferase involved in cell wall biosynthesis